MHNLIAGSVRLWPEPTRFTPYFLPHSTDVAALTTILSGDDRYYNNIFAGNGAADRRDEKMMPGLKIYDDAKLPVFITDNYYFFGAKPSAKDTKAFIDEAFDPVLRIEQKEESVFLHFNVNKSYYNHGMKVLNTAILGKARIPKARFDNPDGTPLTIDRDYLGNIRTEQNNIVGPFVNIKEGMMILKVW